MNTRTVELNVVTWGEASQTAVVLLHGLRGYAHWYDDLAEELQHRHFVLAQDLRGRGGSDFSPDGDYRVDVLVDDLEDILDKRGIENVALVGHSLGGSVALGYAGRHPERVNKLVVADMSPSPAAAGMARTREELASTPAKFNSWDDARAFVSRVHRSVSARRTETRVRWMLREDRDGKIVWRLDPEVLGGEIVLDPPERTWRWIHRVTCPTLVVRGSRSDVLSADAAKAMVTALPEGSQHVDIPNAGHMILDDNPTEFCKVVANFLA